MWWRTRILAYQLNFLNSHQKDKTPQSTNLTRENKK
ncbi:hypothetical protein DDL28_14080 [Staphylococcus aureus]|uniref:Uncharacterized protein n=1 Tax=Staphylococcus aureus TaxID=1280 RepID=A0AAP7JVZ6_STAAU|nr:hypothetical protein [Staphylococcus aureus]MBF1920195.1 hypothetical protein [Staphylococcus aureus]MBW0704946.1 hypothetical protein [Staphylococcus aureus]MBW0710705.1 hypothetical protein [Staphylococcus aureus]MBW0716574.1 hypothetical protein [Staphylococcus aureus]MBW0722222.1 hypothetical protein [Staphylococcus aureus]